MLYHSFFVLLCRKCVSSILLTKVCNFERHLSRLPATPFVLMCLQPGEEIGDQVHANVDQFFRIGQGEAKFALFMILHHLVLEIAVELVPQSAD